MKFSEETVKGWSKGPATTEDTKCENAKTVIKKAIEADSELSKLDVSVFPQGSYCARTNVKQDSDVDVCVRLNSSFFCDYPKEYTKATYNHTSSDMTFSKFKGMVETALVNRFGAERVKRGSKAFDVHANTYHIDADVVPTFLYRDFYGPNESDYREGVTFYPDNGGRIENYPDQTYANGVSKNDETLRRYKRVVRILKRIRNKMQEEGIADAKNVASFLIESMVWNTPASNFGHSEYREDLKQVIAHTWDATQTQEKCNEWTEVNNVKYLFRIKQPWTLPAANKFLLAAWRYMDF